MQWFERLGHTSNPLEVDNDTGYFKYEKELNDLIYYMQSGNISIVEGPDSSGKTTLLNKAAEKLGAKIIDAKNFYVNLDIEIRFKEMYGAKLGSPKNLLLKNKRYLIIDNADYLIARNLEKIKNLFDHNKLTSVVFAADTRNKILLSDSMRKRIGRRIITLRRLTEKDVIIITRKLLGRTIDEKTILTVFRMSANNVKQYLSNCSNMLRYMVDNDKDTVTEKDMGDLFKDSFYVEKDLSKICPSCESKVIKEGDEWVCLNCREKKQNLPKESKEFNLKNFLGAKRK